MADKAKPKAKRAANGHKRAEKFPKGEKLTDAFKCDWLLLNTIGAGGFGDIYAAARADSPSDAVYAIKIEPAENGPLFCERTAYIELGKKENVEEFVALRKLKYLGVPLMHGFGKHVLKNNDYRFIVIDRLGKDVWSHFSKDNSMPYPTILKIALQIVNVYEYMHGKQYVHGDVKGTNLLLGDGKGKENQVYVVDFGLVCKYVSAYTPNPKKMHNGTIEYTSRDAHKGIPTRRGDMEILAYNLLQWVTFPLPWEGLTDPIVVQEKKEKAMASPENFLKDCYKTETPHSAIKEFVMEVCKIEPLDEPDYDKFRSILNKELKKLKSDPTVLEFTTKKPGAKKKTAVNSPKKPAAKSRKKIAGDVESNDENKEMAAEKSKPVVKAGTSKKLPKGYAEVNSGEEDDEKLPDSYDKYVTKRPRRPPVTESQDDERRPRRQAAYAKSYDETNNDSGEKKSRKRAAAAPKGGVKSKEVNKSDDESSEGKLVIVEKKKGEKRAAQKKDWSEERLSEVEEHADEEGYRKKANKRQVPMEGSNTVEDSTEESKPVLVKRKKGGKRAVQKASSEDKSDVDDEGSNDDKAKSSKRGKAKLESESVGEHSSNNVDEKVGDRKKKVDEGARVIPGAKKKGGKREAEKTPLDEESDVEQEGAKIIPGARNKDVKRATPKTKAPPADKESDVEQEGAKIIPGARNKDVKRATPKAKAPPGDKKSDVEQEGAKIIPGAKNKDVKRATPKTKVPPGDEDEEEAMEGTEDKKKGGKRAAAPADNDSDGNLTKRVKDRP